MTFLPLELRVRDVPHSQGLREANEVTQGGTQLRARPTVTTQLAIIFQSFAAWDTPGLRGVAMALSTETETEAEPPLGQGGHGLLVQPHPKSASTCALGNTRNFSVLARGSW